MESDMLKYVFSNSVIFLSKVITIFIDESSGRDNIMQFFKLLNTASPFLIMNDFRIAKQQQQLKRVELLKRLMKNV